MGTVLLVPSNHNEALDLFVRHDCLRFRSPPNTPGFMVDMVLVFMGTPMAQPSLVKLVLYNTPMELSPLLLPPLLLPLPMPIWPPNSEPMEPMDTQHGRK